MTGGIRGDKKYARESFRNKKKKLKDFEMLKKLEN